MNSDNRDPEIQHGANHNKKYNPVKPGSQTSGGIRLTTWVAPSLTPEITGQLAPASSGLASTKPPLDNATAVVAESLNCPRSAWAQPDKRRIRARSLRPHTFLHHPAEGTDIFQHRRCGFPVPCGHRPLGLFAQHINTSKERMDARRPRWFKPVRSDSVCKASRRCKLAWSRASSGIDLLSAPVFRLGSRGVLHHQPFQIGGDAAVLCFCLLEQERLEFGGYPDGNGFWLVQRWNSPVVLC